MDTHVIGEGDGETEQPFLWPAVRWQAESLQFSKIAGGKKFHTQPALGRFIVGRTAD